MEDTVNSEYLKSKKKSSFTTKKDNKDFLHQITTLVKGNESLDLMVEDLENDLIKAE